MYRFFDAVISPALDAVSPRVLLEIGSDAGHGTRRLLTWCRAHDAALHVVDPLPKYDIDEWRAEWGRHLVFHQALSIDALPTLPPVDVALIDGDHNWYTVFNELRLLDERSAALGAPFPLVLLHDVCWPYDRRDLYYDPTTIPEGSRQPYERRGLRLDEPGLAETGGMNAHLDHAVREGGPRNGVRTAVEDFLEATSLDLSFTVVPVVHGLGVLNPRELSDRTEKFARLLAALHPTPELRGVLELAERQRLEAEVYRHEVKPRLAAAVQLERRLGDTRRELQTAERERTRAEQERTRAEQERIRAEQERIRAEQERTRTEADRKEALRAAAALRRRADEETERRSSAERRLAALEEQHRRLLRRRSVRLALSVAERARPAVKLLKAARRRRAAVAARHGTEDTGTRSGPRHTAPSPAHGADQLEVLHHRQPVTVIVPVHNAADEVERCLAALVRNTEPPVDIVVIDDASTDPRIPELLERYRGFAGVEVVTQAQNQGFVRTVNAGFARTSGDVVVLNSDTEVPPRWVRNLRVAAYQHPDIGTVTPLSTSAGVFSAPDAAGGNRLPSDINMDTAGRLVARASEFRYPETPTGHGFCMYVRRAVLDAVGGFDVRAFPRGYGEETDLCLRASQVGFRHIIDDRTYVLHRQAASFGTDRRELMQAGRAEVDQRYPEYTGLVQQLKRSPQLEAARATVGRALAMPPGQVRPRVLMVMHKGAGGTPQTNADLMRGLRGRYDTYLLVSDREALHLSQESDAGSVPLGTYPLDHPWRLTDVTREDYRRIVARLLFVHDIDLVHVRHFLGHTLDLPDVAAGLDVPVVVSLHDFYVVCPTIHLLDQDRRYCAGVCTPGDGSCWVNTKRLGEVPHLKHAWVQRWQEHTALALALSDAVVTTSQQARAVYERALPHAGPAITVIEHGRDLEQARDAAVPPEPGGTIRILVPGNIEVHKGARLIEAIDAEDREGRIDWHFMGYVVGGVDRVGTNHGSYAREDFNRLVRKIAPSFIGIFSITAETYCHTLTEAWGAGVPVLASDIGVLRERVRAHGGGWLLDYIDPATAYAQILRAADDTPGYREQLALADLHGIRTIAEMAADYDALYRRVQTARARRRHEGNLPTAVAG